MFQRRGWEALLQSQKRCQLYLRHARSIRFNFAMEIHLTQINPPTSSNFPSDSYQLLDVAQKRGSAEDVLFDEQVRSVKDWWTSARYKSIHRPYTAEDVVGKRGTLQQEYPSSLMARKLFELLQRRASENQPVHTSEDVGEFQENIEI